MKPLSKIVQAAADIAARRMAEKKAAKPPVDKKKSDKFLRALTGAKYHN